MLFCPKILVSINFDCISVLEQGSRHPRASGLKALCKLLQDALTFIAEYELADKEDSFLAQTINCIIYELVSRRDK